MAVPFLDGFPQFFTDSGAPVSNGWLHTYAAGTLDQIDSFTTVAGDVRNANPVPLTPGGRCELYLSGGVAYRFILKDANLVTIRDVPSVKLLSDTPTASVAAAFTEITASAGQTALTVPTYATGVGAVSVFVDGVMTREFTETSQTTITLDSALEGGEEVVVIAGTIVASGIAASQIGYQYDADDTVARTMAGKLDEVSFSVLDCGSPARDGSNAAATTAAFTTALAVANALIDAGTHGVTIDVPDGAYLLNATLTINRSNIHLRGRGKGVTTLTRASDYGDTLFFTGVDATGTLITNCAVTGMTLASTALTTSGAHVHVNGVAGMTIADIELSQGFKGFYFQAMGPANIRDIYSVFTNLYTGSATGRYHMQFAAGSANYSHPHCGDVHLNNINLRGNIGGEAAQFCVYIQGADGLWFNNFHFGNSTEAQILIENSVAGYGGNINLVSFDTGMCDEGLGYAVGFTGSTNSVAEAIDFSNVRLKGNGSATIGVFVNTGAAFHDINFTDCDVYQFDQHGGYIRSTAATGLTFTDCRFRENGLLTANTYSGLLLDSGVTDVHVRGGKYGGLATSNGTSAQSRGITFAGTASGCSVVDADLSGNVTGGISLPGTGVRFRASPMQAGSYAVASASTLTIPPEYDRATVSGSTSVTGITATYDGHLLELVFSSTAQLTDGSNIKAAGNFTGGADRVWRGRCDGTNWLEIGRSAN